MIAATSDIFVRTRDISSLNNTIRRSRDVVLISPPYSGLSNHLLEIEKHLKSSEQFRQKTVLFIDVAILKNSADKLEFRDNLVNKILDLLGIDKIHDWTCNQRLLEFFCLLLVSRHQLNLVIILDNIQSIEENILKDFLENIRVIASSRESERILERISFILGGHSINLRRLDPEHNSPFNIAERIWLDDFSSSQSSEIIDRYFLGENHVVSRIVLRYIDFLCAGHPYLINLLCESLRNIENLLGTSPKKIGFSTVNQVVNIICDAGRTPIFYDLERTIERLPTDTLDTLRNIVKGHKYSAIKSAPQLDELRLAGIISDSRSNTWHIRNQMFDGFIRSTRHFKKIKYCPIPRRLFVNVEAYQILFNLENDIRDFVMSKMLDVYPDKWQSKIGEDLLNGWAGLKTAEQNSGWYASEEFAYIGYSMFPDLKKVILNKGNWRAIFHKYFKPQDIFAGYFMNLEALRNKIAHNRPLTDRDVEHLEAIVDGFQNCLFD